MPNLILLASLAAYLVGLGLVWRALRAPARAASAALPRRPRGALLGLGVAVLLHALGVYYGCCPTRINLALGYLISVVGCISALLLLLAALYRAVFSLAVVVIPLALLGLGIGVYFPGKPLLLVSLPPQLRWHILIALPAYGILCVAFAQALLLLWQERRLQKPVMNDFYPGLPSLQSMETNLFWLITLGFILLTLNLFFGVYSNYTVSGQWLEFNHHILFILLAWAGFGGVLLGRAVYGWRGRPAALSCISAFALLGLAYYGSRFVTEVILSVE